jgi:hypothetical protein
MITPPSPCIGSIRIAQISFLFSNNNSTDFTSLYGANKKLSQNGPKPCL